MNDANLINPILKRYYEAFKEKTYSDENNDTDVLMDIFGITPEQKRENRQYWGRELGMMWQLIVTEICRHHCSSFKPALRIGSDEPCDLIIGNHAIDTKYRIGSGDSGTITACLHGGWTVLTGTQAFEYLYQNTGVDVYNLLKQFKDKYLLP